MFLFRLTDSRQCDRIPRVTKMCVGRRDDRPRRLTQAQKKFEAAFGGARAVQLRDLLHAVAATDLGGATAADE